MPLIRHDSSKPGRLPGLVVAVLVAVPGLTACTETAEVDAAGEAYEAYLEGMTFYVRGGESNLRQAIDLFSQAVEIDSTSALAHAGLARAYTSIGGNYNILAPEASWPAAREAADRAVRLDDGLAEAHLAQAYVEAGADWDWTGAEQAYQRALNLDPENIEALYGYTWFLNGLGRSEEAAAIAARATDLAPGSTDPFLLYLTTGDAAEAKAAAGNLIAADPSNPSGYWAAALIHTWEGEYEQAAERLQQQIPLMQGDVVDEVALLGHVYGRMGREDDARAMLERLDEVAADGRYVSPVLKAWIHSGLGEAAEAVDWLRTGFEMHAHRSGLDMGAFSYLFDPIREDPGFQELLQELDLRR